MKHRIKIVGGIMLFLAGNVQAQLPHGKELKISCDACHTADSWIVSGDSFSFNHDSTFFILQGQHNKTDCRQCHTTLVFSEAETNCASCHLDVHQQTVGLDCARCHTSVSWLVNNIAEMHRENSFPLLGAHAAADCILCHTSETNLQFEPINTDCFSCHEANYASTTNPDHAKAGFSINCTECHKYDAYEWTASGINHDFFPLIQGHDIQDCARCHTGPDYSSTSPECINCHEAAYLATTSPNHQGASISTTCVDCHSTAPGWKPAEYGQHDAQYFPIYSGSHNGGWNQCADCHDQPGNYGSFTCITCHQSAPMNEEHGGVTGYVYSSAACLACHPNGEADGAFNHDNTGFGLMGGHTNVECLACHASGFTDTPTACFTCHTEDFNQSSNPNHQTLGLSTDCVACHTTDPDWNPAKFDVHDQYYELSGAHALIKDQCITCHNGDYNNTPKTCVGCHQGEYDLTDNPSHSALNFSTDCVSCHTETAWTPAAYTDHDAQYFPIYSGAHLGTWDQCTDCHITPSDYSIYTCVTCHSNPETNEQHTGINGYLYENSACLACHPTGDSQGAFDHATSPFPLTGAHQNVDCVQCHSGGFQNTSTECVACHLPDFNQSTNPNHTSLGLSTDCASCHSPAPNWNPATFDIHDQYYKLEGAHALIRDQCITCHNGNYNSTPNTCVGCHQGDYNQTNDPDHQAAQFPTTCETCHSQNAWIPANWNHDNLYFPIYSGKHKDEWNQCNDCHTNPNSFSVFTCITCHQQGETNNDHNEVNGYQYNSAACYACHPDGKAD